MSMRERVCVHTCVCMCVVLPTADSACLKDSSDRLEEQAILHCYKSHVKERHCNVKVPPTSNVSS